MFKWPPTVRNNEKGRALRASKLAHQIMEENAVRRYIPKEDEVEVFRITPESEQCYEYAEATHIVGEGSLKRYFAKQSNVQYVGSYIDTIRGGSPDDAISIFRNGSKETQVRYSYKGHTCFIKVPCMAKGGKRYRKTKRARRLRRKSSRKNV